MRRLAIPLLAASIFLSSCATYSLTPRSGSDEKIRYNRGIPTISAVKDGIGVAVSSEVSGSQIFFKLYIKNYRDEVLSVDDSAARLEESGTSVKVYRADEYFKKRRNEITTGKVLMVISAALSTSNAGYSSSTTYGTYSRNDFYHHGSGTFSSTTTTYDPSAAALERDIAFARVDQYAKGGDAELNFLKNALFYPSDVEPGGEYYGIIVADFGERAASTMDFSIFLDSTPFSFTFDKEQD